MTLVTLGALAGGPVAAAQPLRPPPPPQYPAYPSETPATLEPTTYGFDYVRRDVMIPMRDGVKLHTVVLVPKGARGRADPAHAHALQRDGAHEPRPELAPRLDPERLRQRDRRHRRGRLHPRGPGRPRQIRLRGRLRDEPPAARAAEPDARRPLHRHLRHHRVAREERAGDERQGRHPGDLLRRLPAPDGARRTRTPRSRCPCP